MDLIKLVDEQIQNKVQFFSILQVEKIITKRNLSKKLNLTNFKLTQLTKEIYSDLENFKLTKSFQLTISKNEVELIELKLNSIYFIRQLYFKNTPLYSYLVSAFYNKKIDVDEFTIQHFISHTTFYRMLKKLNSYTIQMDLKFSASGKIYGEEQRIRAFFVQLSLYVYNGTNYPFQSITYEEIKFYLTYFYKILGSKFDPVQESIYIYWIAVSFERIHCQQIVSPIIKGIYRPIKLDIGHTIKNNVSSEKNRFEKYREYFFSEYRRAYWGITEEQIRTELAYLLLIAFYHYIKSDKNSINTNSLIVTLRNTTRELQDTVYLWIENLTNQLDIPLSDTELLKLSLNLFALHIMSVSVNGLEGYQLDKKKLVNELKLIDEELLTKYNSFFELLFSSKKFNMLLGKHKDSLYTNYLMIILENLAMFTKKMITVSFVTQLGTHTEYEIINTCPKYLKSHFKFIVFDESLTDIIVADNNYLSIKNSSTPKFFIEKKLSAENWHFLLNMIPR